MSDYLVIDSHGGPLHSFIDVDGSFAEEKPPTIPRSNIAQSIRVMGNLCEDGTMPSPEQYVAHLLKYGFESDDAFACLEVVRAALVNLPNHMASVGDFYALAFSMWVLDPKMTTDALYRNFAFWTLAQLDQEPPDQKTFQILWNRTAKARRFFWSLSKQVLS